MANSNRGLTVKDLRAMLKGVPGHHKVVMSTDAEGNQFGFLGGYSKGACKDDGYSVNVGDEEVTEESRAQCAKYGMDPEQFVIKGGKKCVTLWPDR